MVGELNTAKGGTDQYASGTPARKQQTNLRPCGREKRVKEWLGHSEISTTVDIYGHLQYATKKQSAAAIEQDIVAPMLQNLSAVSP